MRKTKVGRIDISELNIPPEKHEYETARYFADRGFDVKFIKPSNIEGTNTPDFVMSGRMWEVKSPTGSSKRTYEDNLKKAVRQSKNVIFDLRRIKNIDENKCFQVLIRNLYLSELECLLVIRKDGRLLTEKGRFDIM